ncbi:hypothetical protein [Corallococcus sp. CA041A]|uniref:hypothetical protein n=1 Tax=Corallococcus sp. CA041A TaxID=2316727 RepID=UPI0011C4107D|nr:hypothetical protein [Corallococcus sp. CA041A]
MTHPLDELSELLLTSNLRPQLIPSRISRPFFYDATYNFSIISCVIMNLGSPQKQDRQTWQINNSILKFCHFLAVRPVLLKDFRIWHEHNSQKSNLELETWPRLPRGFLTDDTQAAAATFLVTTGALQRTGKYTTLKATSDNKLLHLLKTVEEQQLFQNERRTILQLKEMKITQTMLGVA